MMVASELLTREEVSSKPLLHLILPRSFAERMAAGVGILDYRPYRVMKAAASMTTYPKDMQVRWALNLADRAYDEGYYGGTVNGEVLDVWGRYIKDGDWLRLGGWRLNTTGSKEEWDQFNDSRKLWGQAIDAANTGDMGLIDPAYKRIEELTIRRSQMK